jgi:predicted RNase H-like HicB family nuclease
MDGKLWMAIFNLDGHTFHGFGDTSESAIEELRKVWFQYVETSILRGHPSLVNVDYIDTCITQKSYRFKLVHITSTQLLDHKPPEVI